MPRYEPVMDLFIGIRTMLLMLLPDRSSCAAQGTSQNYAAASQNISNYRRTAICPQNRQTFVIFARLKFYLFLSAVRTYPESYNLNGNFTKICENDMKS